MTVPRVRVLLAEDHPVFRRGVVGVLEETADLDVVATVDDGLAAVTAVAQLAPDVVLMDLHLPGLDGIEATRRLLAEDPGVRVLVLTMRSDDEALFAAMRAGARGFLVKGATGEQIVTAVRAVAAGEVLFGADVSGRVLAALTAGRVLGSALSELSARETEVLDLVAAGLRNGDIARKLFLSEKTVRNHVSHIFTKLGVEDRAAAIVLAREAELGRGPAV